MIKDFCLWQQPEVQRKDSGMFWGSCANHLSTVPPVKNKLKVRLCRNSSPHIKLEEDLLMQRAAFKWKSTPSSHTLTRSRPAWQERAGQDTPTVCPALSWTKPIGWASVYAAVWIMLQDRGREGPGVRLGSTLYPGSSRTVLHLLRVLRADSGY